MFVLETETPKSVYNEISAEGSLRIWSLYSLLLKSLAQGGCKPTLTESSNFSTEC